MILAFDSETYLLKPGLLAPPPVCFSFADGDLVTLRDKDAGAAYLAAVLADPDVTLVGANVAYDFAVLCAHRPDLIPAVFRAYADGRVRDVQVRQRLIDIANGCLNFPRADGTKGYSLADLEQHHLRRDRSADKKGENAWRLRYAELDGVPLDQWPEDAVRYAKDDAEGTLAVYAAQEQKHADLLRDEAAQVRGAWGLHLMSAWGIRTDGDAVTTLEAVLLKEQAKNFEVLNANGFFKTRRATRQEVEAGQVDIWEEPKKAGKEKRPLVYAKDMAVIQERVTAAYATMGKKPPLTESGRIATDKDTLKSTGDEVLELLADGGGVDKILTTYVPALKQGATVPINARFNVLVNSGRTSCGEPNLQNLPTGRRVGGVRECFVPRPGFWMVSVDYSTLELRTLAQVCLWLFGKSKMAEALQAGKDLHIAMAANMLGISYSEGEARHNAKDKDFKRARDCAKVANFGMPGGLGAASLVDYARTGYGVELSEPQAWELKREWLATWPEMDGYFKFVNDQVGLGGAQIEQFVSKRLRGDVGYCDGCNTFFQGLAADGAKAAVFDVAWECYVDKGTALYGSRPVAFIHDEIVAEVPADSAHEAGLRLAEVMCQAMSRYVPDIPVLAVPALMTRWEKGAEAVYASRTNKRLVPWQPGVRYDKDPDGTLYAPSEVVSAAA